MTRPDAEIADVVASLWRRELDVAAIGETDDFFDLGGGSLQAVHIVSRLRDLLGVDLPVGVFDRESTFGAFVTAVAAACGADRTGDQKA